MKCIFTLKKLGRLSAGLAAAFFATTAFAGRYWLGTTDDASDTANWASSRDGSSGKSAPDSTTGTTYFYDYKNGKIVFKSAIDCGGNSVLLNTGASDFFEFDADDDAYGFAVTSGDKKGFALAGNTDVNGVTVQSPTNLKIKRGTYTMRTFYVAQGENSEAKLVLDGGTLNINYEGRVGAGNGSQGELVLESGKVNINYSVFYVGEYGTGKLTINGGEFAFTNPDSQYGLSFCRRHSGSDGLVELNAGGTLTIPKYRLDTMTDGCTGTMRFNGGTLRAMRDTTSFLDESDGGRLTCEIAEGGLVIDTDGHDITIKHALSGVGGVVKKGEGTLTLSGANTFEGGITVLEGAVVANGQTYEPASFIDIAGGGNLGEYQLHGEKFEGWLEDPDFMTYAQYDGNGKKSLERPRALTFGDGSETKTYANLKTGTTVEDTIGETAFSFKTKATAPRTLDLAGVENVRDVGSWPLMGGKAMNQGMIYRGGELDVYENNTTAEARAAGPLAGLKTEIDLRTVGLDGSFSDHYRNLPAEGAKSFDDCSYCRFSLGYNEDKGTNLGADDNGNFTNSIRKVFATLGTPGSLPAYFHCRIGRDRTGVVSMLLLSFMGASEETVYRDYLASNFANLGDARTAEVPERFFKYLYTGECGPDNMYSFAGDEYGDSAAARARAYLEMCGVTSEQLGVIANALSGETLDQILERVNAYETENNIRTVKYVPYEGSATVSAIHRLAAGENRLPLAAPVRDGYDFKGWDTANEANGIVYANWEIGAAIRFWSDRNGEFANFVDKTSWTPEPVAAIHPGDTLVMNNAFKFDEPVEGGQGEGFEMRVAKFGTGDNLTVANVTIGWGTIDGTAMDAAYDFGGRLDIDGGQLNVTDTLWVGNGYCDNYSTYLNISGGADVTVGKLLTGECASNNGKSNNVAISGSGTRVTATAGESRLSTFQNGTTHMSITDGAIFSSTAQNFVIGKSGKADLTIDGGELDLGTEMSLVLGAGGVSEGALNLTNGTVNAKYLTIGQVAGGKGEVNIGEGGRVTIKNVVYVGEKGQATLDMTAGELTRTRGDWSDAQTDIGRDAGSVGLLHVGGTAEYTDHWSIYLGRSGGVGTLTIDGDGEVYSKYSVLLCDGDSAAPGSTINLNGGVLKTMEIKSSKARGIFNWNGGTLSHNAETVSSDIIPAGDNLVVNVLGGGAIYETLDRNDKISHTLSGPGALVKRGKGKLTVTGLVHTRGGIVVEGGALDLENFDGGESKPVKLVSVAENATLDLHNADVWTYRYTVNGVDMQEGEYPAHNGVINVMAATEGEPAFAEWTNATGDGDATNLYNWTITNARGVELIDAELTENVVARIPATLAVPANIADITVAKVVYYLAEGELYLRGRNNVPDVVRAAKGWYDFDDALTVHLVEESGSTSMVSVDNKGTAGAELDAEVFGNDGDPAPQYGVCKFNGRDVMAMTTSDTDTTSRKGLQTAELGLQPNQDRAIVVLSRRGSGSTHYPITIETQDNTNFNPEKCLGHFRIQRFGFFSDPFFYSDLKESKTDETTGEVVKTYEGKNFSVGQGIDDWSISLFQSENLHLTGMVYSKANGLKTGTKDAVDLNTQANERLYIGHARFNHDAVNNGQVAEAMYFDRALTEAEITDIYDYLKVKWFECKEIGCVPANLEVADGATLDFGGGSWTFDAIDGAGTIGNANITVNGSIDAGVTVGGTVTFGEDATIDISGYEKTAPGTRVVVLTAKEIVNPPTIATSAKRRVALELVDNEDGTWSLVGTLDTRGMRLYLR